MKVFDIPDIFKSKLISKIKESRRLKDKLKKDFSPTVLDFGPVKVQIARHFGFCYGVENAVEIAYRTLAENPEKRIFLLSEMIHNPEVNADLLSRGIRFLMDTSGNRLIEIKSLNADDIVIVPAFGTTIEIQSELAAVGIDPYKFDTTCPFVEKVWNRAAQIGERGYTVIVHGKPGHEETRATFSHSQSGAPTLIIKDIKEAEILAKYIKNEAPIEQFYVDFENRYSDGFDPAIHLSKIGVVNQTTMLAIETQEIADYLKNVITNNFKSDDPQTHFASTRDTLCYATNDNQDATYALLDQKADMAFVVGGYNSSNTTHIVELLEKNIQTFFVSSEKCFLDNHKISHFDIHNQKVIESDLHFDKIKQPNIILTCGASCPDAVVEAVLYKILNKFDVTDFDIDSLIF